MKQTVLNNFLQSITFVIISIYILVPKFIFAEKEDSLLKLLKHTKIDSIKFDVSARLYNFNLKEGNLEIAKIYIDSIIKISLKIKKEKFLCTAYQLKAKYYYKMNLFDSAIFYNNKSLVIASKINYYLPLIRCNVNLGNIYNQKADHTKAILHFQKAEQFSILSHDTLGQISTIVNIGNIYFYMNDYKQAKKYFIKAINISSFSQKYKSELSNASNNLGTNYLNETPKNIDSALYFYNKFLKLSIELNLESNIALAHYNIAEVYRIKKDIKKAREHYLFAEKTYRNDEDTIGIIKICLSIADIYMMENNNLAAIIILKEGLLYSIKFETVDKTSEFYKSLSSAYYNIGKYKESIDNYKKGTILSDSLYNADNSKILYDMQTKYETNEKEKQNKLLEAENIISTKTIKQQKLITYFIISGLLIVTLLAFFIFKGLKKQRKANEIISRQKKEVEQQKKEVEDQKQKVEEHQKEIIDSINYACRIQKALLPNDKYILRKLSQLNK